jgi:hypothetical protein
MNTRFKDWLPIWLLVCLSLARCGTSAEAQNKEEWVPLFNGRDLSGWVSMHEGLFIVTNGCLRLLGGTGWLRTEKEYTDFVLEAEWRALEPQYDSGFFVRAGLEGKPWPNDVWQIDLSGRALGALVKGNKTLLPAETPRMPLHQWVKFRIEVRGKKVTLDVDGERAWEFDGLDVVRGYIGIQAENKSFEFRNLRLSERPPGPRS